MALNRYVDVLINNKDCKATLKEPLYIFEHDKNAHIYFRLIDHRYQFKMTPTTEEDWNIIYNLNGADAWITIVKPDGSELEQGKEGSKVNNVILRGEYVRFNVSPDLTDEMAEIGIYQLQIHITDKEGGEVTVPFFTFEVKERLKGTSQAAAVLLLTEEGNNLTTEQGTPMVASGNGVTISSLPARNTYTGNEYMAVAFGGATYKMPTSLLKGADGITPTLKIGTVNTLPAGANATVTATTSNNIVTLDFGIPRGADGSGGSGSGDGHTHANKTELDKFVSGDKAKLDTASTHAGTAHAPSNAEQNVQSDWNVTDTSSDAYIKNKPAIPAVTQVVDNLTSTDTNKALSANQGKVLDEKVATNASSIAEITQNFNNHINNHPSGGNQIDDVIISTEKAWSSSKTQAMIQTIPKGDKGDPGTASVAIDDTVTNNSQTWTSQKILNEIGNNIWNNKTATFYGDSLTEVNSHYTKGYHEWVKELLGLTSYQNYGISGYKLSDIYNKVNTTNVVSDLIIIMGGVNDQNFSVPLGTITDNTTNTIYGSLNLLCSKLKEKYPSKILLFITPHYQTRYPHGDGITSLEVSKAIKEVCVKYAIPVYDNFNLGGIYNTNLSIFTTDNCHWNNFAHEMVGKNLARFINNNFRYIYNGNDSTVVYGNIVLSKTSTTITEGQSDTFTVKLDKAPTNNQVVTLSKDNSDVTLSITSLTFTPSNYSIAQTVTINVAEDNEDYSNETCTITLLSPNVATKTLLVNIIDNDEAPSNIPVKGVTLDKNTHTFKVGETVQLIATILPSDATNKDITWTSSDTNKAIVSTNGLITAKAEGSATITVTTKDGSKTATCILTIQPIENIDNNEFIGKRFTITGLNYNNYFHFVALINADVSMNTKVLKMEVRGTNIVNLINGNNDGCTLFCDTSGEVSNSQYTTINSGNANSVNVVDGTNFTATIEARNIFDIDDSAKYLKVPIMIFTEKIPSSFIISKLSVTIDNVEQKVLKIGGFFNTETFTLE